MRLYLVCALFLVSAADAGFTCEREEGLFPSSRCHQFVQCMNWYPYLFECPYPLHYDARSKLCDWPNKVGCTLDSEQEDIGKRDATTPEGVNTEVGTQ